MPATISSTGEGTRTTGTARTTSGAANAIAEMISRLVNDTASPYESGQGVEHPAVEGGVGEDHRAERGCRDPSVHGQRLPARGPGCGGTDEQDVVGVTHQLDQACRVPELGHGV
jgi:hypothetical protein